MHRLRTRVRLSFPGSTDVPIQQLFRPVRAREAQQPELIPASGNEETRDRAVVSRPGASQRMAVSQQSAFGSEGKEGMFMSCPGLWRKVGYLIGLVTLFTFVSEPRSSGQKAKRPGAQQELPETRELFATEMIPFTAPPPLLVDPAMKCDLNGNIYLVYSDAPEAVLSQGNAVARLPIQKLSVEHKTAVQFPIPVIPDYESVLRYDFDVDGRGKVYALLSAWNEPDQKDKPSGAYLIVKYKDDGTMDSFTKIRDVPGEHLQPLRFVAFPDGNFLLSGTNPGERGLVMFTAVFDRGGAFVTDVKVPEDADIVTPKAATGSADETTGQEAASSGRASSLREGREPHPPRGRGSKVNPVGDVSQGLALGSPDGNIYMLRATDPPRLYVVAPGGNVVREFEITRPAPGLSPIQMAMAGDDKLFIQFAHIATGAPGENNNALRLITVIDSQTGQAMAVYRLAPKDVSAILSAGCAISPYSFLFVGTSEDNKLKVIRYSP